MASVAFVLVETKTPGNIGAVCRVAKAFGFPDVRLVRPAADLAADEARWLAHGAEDVLAAAPVFAELRDAIAGCWRAAATTARPRHWGRPVLRPGEVAESLARRAAQDAATGPYALVFGPEDRGLTNEDLGECDEIVSIPLPVDRGASLSLPQSASIVAWELSRTADRAASPPAARRGPSERSSHPLDSAEIDGLVARMIGTLDTIGFRPRPNPLLFRGSLRDFVARARPTRGDDAVLRGMFAQVGKWRRRLDGEHRRGER